MTPVPTDEGKHFNRKLIEVALPLSEINDAAAKEKNRKVGKPQQIHHWWAGRPIVACRAVLFAQLVDDPSAHPDKFPTEEDQVKERERLFEILRQLIQWENSANERIMDAVDAAIRQSLGGDIPPVFDPFAGRGVIPMEAQRLGLKAMAADLNPVAVVICKALTELPFAFGGHAPVSSRRELPMDDGAWPAAMGLAADVRYYGQWMLDQARARIGDLYPPVHLPDGSHAPVIAYVWARTVVCPNPACGGRAPLLHSFTLSSKQGKRVWMRPVSAGNHVTFDIVRGDGAPADGTVSRRGGRCLLCGSPIPLEHVRSEGRGGRLRSQLLAVVAEGRRERIYLRATEDQVRIADVPKPTDVLRTELPKQALGFRVQAYGLLHHTDLFTPRQLTAMVTFADLVREAREKILEDGVNEQYANAVATYLSLVVSRMADWNNALCHWEPVAQVSQQLLGEQAIPMAWDFSEANPLGKSTGSCMASVRNVARSLELAPAKTPAAARLMDATQLPPDLRPGSVIVCTDPPYYDNIGYANLADFFYVWMRRSIGTLYPDLFATMLTPKRGELVADAHRSGTSLAARADFEKGFRAAVENLARVSDPRIPIAIFYAFKQAETDGTDHVVSTGWETMLKGLIESKLTITSTWPIRTEASRRRRALDSNALSSSIVITCRTRSTGAGIMDRKGLLTELRATLPARLRMLQQETIAPVDLAQAAIGPGMEVFSRYDRVLEADGTAMDVRIALALINQVLDEVLSAQDSEFDPETRWAVSWFEQHGFGEGPFGDAETLSKARVTSVGRLENIGVVVSKGGKVRLRSRVELDAGDGFPDPTGPVWTLAQVAANRLAAHSEVAAAEVFATCPSSLEAIRDLVYRLHAIAQKQGRAEDAACYNDLGGAWADVRKLANEISTQPRQESLL